MPDGLYQVKARPSLCAGFEIKDGEVVAIAPILVKRFSYWKQVARLVKH